MMQVKEINEGPKISYEESGTRVFFGDDELMLNMAKYQRDWPVHIDVCSNRDEQLVIGTGEGLYYVAQLDVPAIQYEETEEPETQSGEGTMSDREPPKPIALNMDDVVLTLWSTENQTPAVE